MATIASYNFDDVTAPAIPTGLTVSANVTTSTTQKVSGTNSLKLIASGTETAQETAAGDCAYANHELTVSVYLAASMQSIVYVRESSGGTFTANYHTRIIQGTAFRAYRRPNSGTNTQLATVGDADTFAASTWYRQTTRVEGIGTTCTVKGKVQRVADSQWLQTDGTWGASEVWAISYADTNAARLTKAGSVGLAMAGGTGYADDWLHSADTDAYLISIVGNSMSDPTTSTWVATMQTAYGNAVRIVNTAVSGESTKDIVATRWATNLAAYDSHYTEAVHIAAEISNDIKVNLDPNGDAYTASQILARMYGHCDDAQTAGYKVIVWSVLPRQDFNATMETARTDIIAALVTAAGWEDHADALFDPNALTIVYKETGTTTPGIHPTDATGTNIIAPAMKTLIDDDFFNPGDHAAPVWTTGGCVLSEDRKSIVITCTDDSPPIATNDTDGTRQSFNAYVNGVGIPASHVASTGPLEITLTFDAALPNGTVTLYFEAVNGGLVEDYNGNEKLTNAAVVCTWNLPILAIPNVKRFLLSDADIATADAAGRVSTWGDQSGLDHDAVQTTALNQPFYDETAGDPVVQMSNTDTPYNGAMSVTGNVAHQAYTAFAVVDTFTSQLDVPLCSAGNGPGTFGWYQQKVWCRTVAGNVSSTIPQCWGVSVVGVRYGSSKTTLYQNYVSEDVAVCSNTGSPTAQSELGRWGGATTAKLGIRATFEADRALSDDEINVVLDYFRAKYRILPFINNLVFVGDSITWGRGSTANCNLMRYIKASSLPRNYSAVNNGVPSDTWALLVARWAATNAYKITGKTNWLFPRCGTNDLGAGRTPAQAADDAASYCATAKAAGWNVCLCAITDATTIAGGWATISDYNERLRALVGNGNVDAFSDVTRDARMRDATNATYFDSGLHPTNAGYQVMANETVRDLRRLLYGAGSSVVTPAAGISIGFD